MQSSNLQYNVVSAMNTRCYRNIKEELSNCPIESWDIGMTG